MALFFFVVGMEIKRELVVGELHDLRAVALRRWPRWANHIPALIYIAFSGILLAGIVIGSLGVLDDVTVTQVSAVGELHKARPDAPRRRISSVRSAWAVTTFRRRSAPSSSPTPGPR